MRMSSPKVACSCLLTVFWKIYWCPSESPKFEPGNQQIICCLFLKNCTRNCREAMEQSQRMSLSPCVYFYCQRSTASTAFSITRQIASNLRTYVTNIIWWSSISKYRTLSNNFGVVKSAGLSRLRWWSATLQLNGRQRWCSSTFVHFFKQKCLVAGQSPSSSIVHKNADALTSGAWQTLNWNLV